VFVKRPITWLAALTNKLKDLIISIHNIHRSNNLVSSNNFFGSCLFYNKFVWLIRWEGHKSIDLKTCLCSLFSFATNGANAQYKLLIVLFQLTEKILDFAWFVFIYKLVRVGAIVTTNLYIYIYIYIYIYLFFWLIDWYAVYAVMHW
jgi:hypothetical protein